MDDDDLDQAIEESLEDPADDPRQLGVIEGWGHGGPRPVDQNLAARLLADIRDWETEGAGRADGADQADGGADQADGGADRADGGADRADGGADQADGGADQADGGSECGLEGRAKLRVTELANLVRLHTQEGNRGYAATATLELLDLAGPGWLARFLQHWFLDCYALAGVVRADVVDLVCQRLLGLRRADRRRPADDPLADDRCAPAVRDEGPDGDQAVLGAIRLLDRLAKSPTAKLPLALANVGLAVGCSRPLLAKVVADRPDLADWFPSPDTVCDRIRALGGAVWTQYDLEQLLNFILGRQAGLELGGVRLAPGLLADTRPELRWVTWLPVLQAIWRRATPRLLQQFWDNLSALVPAHWTADVEAMRGWLRPQHDSFIVPLLWATELYGQQPAAPSRPLKLPPDATLADLRAKASRLLPLLAKETDPVARATLGRRADQLFLLDTLTTKASPHDNQDAPSRDLLSVLRRTIADIRAGRGKRLEDILPHKTGLTYARRLRL